VIDFPKAEARWQVTSFGGGDCHWTRNGKEIVSMNGGTDTIAAIEVSTAGGKFQLGQAKRLFRTTRQNTTAFAWDVTPDGNRFLVNSQGELKTHDLTLLMNWTPQAKK
jgi:hypothetical protein